MKVKCLRKIFCGIMTVLGCWLWWESYKMTVNWSKRDELFPLPFYIVWLPHWFVVDLAILIIIVAYIIGAVDMERKGGKDALHT